MRLPRLRGGMRARVVTVVAILALFFQMFAAIHVAMPTKPDLAVVAANLKLVLGDSVVLCVQADDRGETPSQPCDNDAHCPLCLLASHVALDVPATPAAILARAEGHAQALALAPDDPKRPVRRAAFAQARAPPKTV